MLLHVLAAALPAEAGPGLSALAKLHVNPRWSDRLAWRMRGRKVGRERTVVCVLISPDKDKTTTTI